MVFWGLAWGGGGGGGRSGVWGGHKHFCHISGWGGGSSMFFQRDWGCRQNFYLPHENVIGTPTPPSNK